MPDTDPQNTDPQNTDPATEPEGKEYSNELPKDVPDIKTYNKMHADTKEALRLSREEVKALKEAVAPKGHENADDYVNEQNFNAEALGKLLNVHPALVGPDTALNKAMRAAAKEVGLPQEQFMATFGRLVHPFYQAIGMPVNDEQVEAFKKQKLEELGPGAEDIIKRVDEALDAVATKRPDDADLIERLKNDGRVTDIVHDLIVSIQPNPEANFQPAATGNELPTIEEIREAMAKPEFYSDKGYHRKWQGYLEAYGEQNPGFRTGTPTGAVGPRL